MQGPVIYTEPPAGYRLCVGIYLVRADGRVFMGERAADSDPERTAPVYAWQMPQGGVDRGEDLWAAAQRELFEETSIRSIEKIAEREDWLTYDLPGVVAGQAWRGRFRGQTQRWFALRFTGDESEINVRRPGDGRFKAEFKSWRWEDPARLAELIVPFKRAVYEQVVNGFADLG